MGFVARQTGQPEPFHVCRHVQWKTCWQRIVISPAVSSMRSRHTGQVGSSVKSGVGGGNGLSELARFVDVESVFSSFARLGVSTVIDLIKVT